MQPVNHNFLGQLTHQANALTNQDSFQPNPYPFPPSNPIPANVPISNSHIVRELNNNNNNTSKPCHDRDEVGVEYLEPSIKRYKKSEIVETLPFEKTDICRRIVGVAQFIKAYNPREERKKIEKQQALDDLEKVRITLNQQADNSQFNLTQNLLMRHIEFKENQRLLATLYQLQMANKETDVCLKSSIDGEQIYIHSVILEQLESLKLHLSDQFKIKIENNKKVISFNFPIDDIKSIIHYLYTKEVKITKENLLGIYAIADYLKIENIQKRCLSLVENIITPDNALNFFVQFQVYTNHPIYKFLLEYVLARASIIFDLNKLDIKSVPKDILTIILSHDQLNLEEKKVFEIIKAWLEAQPKLDEATIKAIAGLLRLGLIKEEDRLEILASSIKGIACYNQEFINQSLSNKARKVMIINGHWIANNKLELDILAYDYYFIYPNSISTDIKINEVECSISISYEKGIPIPRFSVYMEFSNPITHQIQCKILSKKGFAISGEPILENNKYIFFFPLLFPIIPPSPFLAYSPDPASLFIRDGYLDCKIQISLEQELASLKNIIHLK